MNCAPCLNFSIRCLYVFMVFLFMFVVGGGSRFRYFPNRFHIYIQTIFMLTPKGSGLFW
jgi:hypothetical protein